MVDKDTACCAQREMPRYKCHKDVHALKIEAIETPKHPEMSGAMIHPAEIGYEPFQVTDAFLAKHEPKVGGYYVVYEDGHTSCSPAKAFEEGYVKA